MRRIRILLADDGSLFREALVSYLSADETLEIVGEAVNGAEAVQLATTLQPDVVVMDVRMPILDGVGATRRLRDEVPGCRVLLLTSFDDEAYVFQGLRAGAVGYLLKDADPADFIKGIRAAAKGDSFLEPSVATKVVAEFARLANASPARPAPMIDRLSEREVAILRLVATGTSNREIANALHITEGSVKNQMSTIMGKLGTRDRAHAVVTAKDLGWI
ncbi:MAG: response regulator transcription factor [Herpetosiphon sp.]